MKKFLLQDASNAGWVKSQEARTKQNSINTHIHLQAFPELSRKSRASIDVAAAEARIQQQQIRRLCGDIIDSTIETAFSQLSLQCDASPLAVRPTSSRYSTMTWKDRSVVIFYYFHPALGNMDAEVTCRVFGVRNSTFTNWVSKHSFYPKWIPFLEHMTLSTVLPSIPTEFRVLFDDEELDMDSGVSIPVRFRTPTTKRFITATSHPQVTRQKAVKFAKKSEGVTYLTTSVKTVGHGRSLKYPTETLFLLDEVKKSWESGNPISRHEIYLRLIQQFGRSEDEAAQSEFCSIMKLNDGGISPALAQWVRRRLEGANWSIRKESVSQKVPTNWVAIAFEASQKIRTNLKACTVLINADEVFIKFFPRDTEFVVPTRTKRVGSNVASDAKKGCTVMVSAEMYSSMILPPFIVMTATHNGTLARRFSTWRQDGGDASVNFQPSHWMDTPTAKKYVDFLVSLFPGQTIGLIWDAASAHICQEVIDYLDMKGIMHELSPAGLTCIMQICDLYANRPLKAAIKKKFLQWKVSQTIPAGGKYKVDRVQMIHWIEETVPMVNEHQASARKVEYMFGRLGQDPRQPNNQLFHEHMSQLQDNEVYSSLLLNQTAESLE